MSQASSSKARESLFRIDVKSDSPKIIGTSWWNDSVKEFSLGLGRRELLIGGAVLGVFATAQIAGAIAGGISGPELEVRRALDVQRQYGWSLGAPQERLSFPASTPLDPARAERLPGELTPQRADLRPFHVGTLFEALNAAPTQQAAEEPTPQRMGNAIHPWPRDELAPFEQAGKVAAQTFWKVPGVCFFVDLPGRYAVAFAAGASTSFEPVFLFDNWPHPRGVVPAHETLGAAVTYQDTLYQAGLKRGQTGAPMFVLDKNRLNAYFDDSSQFDNRYIAKMPPVKSLVALGLREIVYIAAVLPESDDINDDFVEYKGAGINLRYVLWSDLVTGAPENVGFVPNIAPRLVTSTPLDPLAVGAVAVAVQGGRVLGGKLWRNGSWNRVSTSSSYGGG